MVADLLLQGLGSTAIQIVVFGLLSGRSCGYAAFYNPGADAPEMLTRL